MHQMRLIHKMLLLTLLSMACTVSNSPLAREGNPVAMVAPLFVFIAFLAVWNRLYKRTPWV